MTGILTRREIIHTDNAQRKSYMKTQGEGSHMHTKERGSEGTTISDTLILDFKPSEL